MAGDVDHGRGVRVWEQGRYGNSVFSVQFGCESKTALKNNVLKKRKKHNCFCNSSERAPHKNQYAVFTSSILTKLAYFISSSRQE